MNLRRPATMVMPGIVLLLALTGAQPAAAWDRARLVRALEQLARTGEPHHIDHDEGQELWAALKPALAAPDAELRALATRAALPIVPDLDRSVLAVNEELRLSVRATTVLPVPWPVHYKAVLYGSVDGADWRKLTTIPSGLSAAITLNGRLPRSALKPGVHMLSVRTRIVFDSGTPAAPRIETRDFEPLPYAIWDPLDRTDPVRASIEDGRRVLASALQAGLPDQPLRSWLATFAEVTDDRVQSCWMREPTPEAVRSPAVCLVTRASGRNGTGTEVWVRIGSLAQESGRVLWDAQRPSLVAAYMIGSPMPEVLLSQVPTFLASAMETWPSPIVVVEPSAIQAVPAAPKPGDRGVVTIRVSNPGTARAIGVDINVVVATDEQHGLSRRFIRDIEPGMFVDVEMPVVFDAPYAIVNVLVVNGGAHAVFPPADTSLDQPVATALINRPAMPAGLVERACGALVGTAACGG